MSVLELSRISIEFGDLSIVEKFDLSLEPGVMHCLAGRSGSGKTSLLRVAAGLSAPTSGTVMWGDVSLADLSDNRIAALRREHLGYLDQGGALIPGLAALENVLIPAVPTKRVSHFVPRALELLERLGVAGRADHRPAALSGGERQRVAFARAMLLSPAVLMVDEPTASLDRTSADSVIGILRDLADEGTAILVSAHDENLIRAADSRTVLA